MLEEQADFDDSINTRAVKMHYQSCINTNILPDDSKGKHRKIRM